VHSNKLYGDCKALNTPKGKCKVVTGYDFVGDAFTGVQTGPAAIRGGTPVGLGQWCGWTSQWQQQQQKQQQNQKKQVQKQEQTKQKQKQNQKQKQQQQQKQKQKQEHKQEQKAGAADGLLT
jgi:uncharacterized protein HemX